jgi:hypothetical protein
MAKAGADMYLSGYHQIPSGVENPDQVKYGKMDFSDIYGADHLSTATCVQKFLNLQMMTIFLFLL